MDTVWGEIELEFEMKSVQNVEIAVESRTCEHLQNGSELAGNVEPDRRGTDSHCSHESEEKMIEEPEEETNDGAGAMTEYLWTGKMTLEKQRKQILFFVLSSNARDIHGAKLLFGWFVSQRIVAWELSHVWF